MYKKIIWATDGSEEAAAALLEARRLARAGAARIVAVHCDERLAGRAMGYPVLADEEDVLSEIRHRIEQLRRAGVDIESRSPTESRAAGRGCGSDRRRARRRRDRV